MTRLTDVADILAGSSLSRQMATRSSKTNSRLGIINKNGVYLCSMPCLISIFTLVISELSEMCCWLMLKVHGASEECT